MSSIKIGVTLITASAILILTTVSIGVIQAEFFSKTETIEGRVTYYKIYDDYIYIEFNNDSDGYEISYSYRYGERSMDFTVSSNMVIELKQSGAYWNYDNRWGIERIIKVPENPVKGR